MDIHHTIPDDESFAIDIADLLSIVRRKYKAVLCASLVILLLGTGFSFLLYKEKFASRGTLIFTGSEPTNVITNLEISNRFFNSQGTDSSPLKNQEKLLTSRRLASDVFNQLKTEGWSKQLKSVQRLQDLIKITQIKGTNFIEIVATTSNPKLSQKIVQSYMTQYQKLVDEVTLRPLRQQRLLFKTQVAVAETALSKLNSQLEAFQTTYGIVDINTESQQKVLSLEGAQSAIKDLEAALAEKNGLLAQIQRQLNLRPKNAALALKAVAAGQNTQLLDLQTKLEEAEKEFAVKAKTFAFTNPDMVALNDKINFLKKQITDQQILTVGQKLDSGALIIRDSIRSTLVQSLANTEGEISALNNKLSTIRRQHSQLLSSLSGMPSQQLVYAHLQLEKKNQEEILMHLKQKLAEVEIQESASYRKVQTIDVPDLDQKPLFPNRFDVVFLTGLAGFALSSVGVLGFDLLTRKNSHPELAERLGLQTFSIIPSIAPEKTQHYRQRGILETTAYPPEPDILKAYQDLALNLKARRNKQGDNTFVFSPLLNPQDDAFLIANLAFCLAQSGESVLLIDASLRNPQLHQCFNHSLDYERGLPELINGIADVAFRAEQSEANLSVESFTSLLEQSILPSGIHGQLQYVNAGTALDNVFEFLNAKSFRYLVYTAQARYDWVFLVTPPFLKYPDASILLEYVNGLILILDTQADEHQLQAAVRRVEALNSSVIGTVWKMSDS